MAAPPGELPSFERNDGATCELSDTESQLILCHLLFKGNEKNEILTSMDVPTDTKYFRSKDLEKGAHMLNACNQLGVDPESYTMLRFYERTISARNRETAGGTADALGIRELNLSAGERIQFRQNRADGNRDDDNAGTKFSLRKLFGCLKKKAPYEIFVKESDHLSAMLRELRVLEYLNCRDDDGNPTASAYIRVEATRTQLDRYGALTRMFKII